jgi:hypothetical protein
MKKLQFLNVLIFTIVLLLLFQCDPWDSKMKIINNSSSAIYYNDSYRYPDTTLRTVPSPIFFANSLVLPGETVSYPVRGTWNEVFDICDTLMIFIFDETKIKNVPWDTIKKNYMILKRYDLSLEDLVKLDWRVTYPKKH